MKKHIPHEDRYMSKESCQTLYKNLLQLSKNNNALPSHFIRELEQTRRCDDMGTNFSHLREKYESHFNDQMGSKEAYENLLNIKTRNNSFEYIAAQTVVHYMNFTEEEIKKAFNFKNRIWYHIMYKSQDTLATLGILGTVFGGYKGLRKLYDNYRRSI